MSHAATRSDVEAGHGRPPALNGETRERIGSGLRLAYENTVETAPIPDSQVDLLLQLRHRERDLRRAS